MAISKCAKCENTFFELKENAPTGAAFKVQFVQCSKCGTVVGVLEYHNTGAMVQNVERRLLGLEESLKKITNRLGA